MRLELSPSVAVIVALELSRQKAAGSSPGVPAIHSKRVIRRDTENSYPQSHPQLLLNVPRFESHGIEKLFLRRNHLVKVFVAQLLGIHQKNLNSL